jgi:hypothetical protein
MQKTHGGGAGTNVDMEREDTTVITHNRGEKVEEESSRTYSPGNFGSYLIRVRLYNIGPHGEERLARTAEEAFFQTVSRDVS